MEHKTLVLAEKPSVGKELARVLNCSQFRNGYFQGSKYLVTWALGHLVTLAAPEEYFSSWGSWKLEDLPMVPSRFKTSIIKQTSKQFNLIKSLLNSQEVNNIIIATDAGREGELVARWIIEKAKVNKPIKRLWISSMTDQAIRDGFNQLKDGSKYLPLYDSAYARSIADWVVGINVTRALTCKYNAQLSAGRVQTPTLAIIIDREEQIRRFVPIPYYLLNLNYQNTKFTYLNKQNERRIWQQNDANNLLNQLSNKEARVTSIKQTKAQSAPPLLYDLTQLQRDANNLYGYTPKQTLDIMQRLYEHHKILTYPRTDSRHLTTDLIPVVSKLLPKLVSLGSDYQKYVNLIIKKPLKTTKQIFDNLKVSDHHAIIPTELVINLNRLELNEKRIYELVVKRFITVFLDDYQYLKTEVMISIDQANFITKGVNVIDLGYKAFSNNHNHDDGDEDEDAVTIPEFKQNQIIKNYKLSLKSEQTTPPSRYTLSTLLGAMESPSKFVEDPQMKKILEQSTGLGTPATRADIIDKLFSVNYLELKGKSIYPTSKAIQLMQLVPTSLKSPLLTAQYEKRLGLIATGVEKKDQFINDIIKTTYQLVDEVLSVEKAYLHDNQTSKRCPNCQEPLLRVDQKGKSFLVCRSRECGYRQTIAITTNATCPNCRKKLNIISSQDTEYFVCKCGFKEKKESFVNKLKERGNQMNKKEISNYLKKQNQDIPTNNPFMDAFKDK